MYVRYLVSGDSTLIVEFGDEISPDINRRVIALMEAMDKKRITGVIELVPTYRSLGINYDPLILDVVDLKKEVSELKSGLDSRKQSKQRMIEIPVVYGGEYGPDLENVAKYNGLNKEEAVRLHSSRNYLVYMLGFTPGFPYLGGMDEKIATPRLEVPRKVIKGGSVGIAGSQTGIYPIDSPGGWQIIGRTPLKLFDAASESKFLLEPGDILKFIAVDEREYERIKKETERNNYRLRIKGG